MTSAATPRRCRPSPSGTPTGDIRTVKGPSGDTVTVLSSLRRGTSRRNTISHQVPASSARRIERNSFRETTESWLRLAPSSTRTLYRRPLHEERQSVLLDLKRVLEPGAFVTGDRCWSVGIWNAWW